MSFPTRLWHTVCREGSIMDDRNDRNIDLLKQELAAGAWQFFCQTGLPEAYLFYAFEKEEGEPR